MPKKQKRAPVGIMRKFKHSRLAKVHIVHPVSPSSLTQTVTVTFTSDNILLLLTDSTRPMKNLEASLDEHRKSTNDSDSTRDQQYFQRVVILQAFLHHLHSPAEEINNVTPY